MIMIVGCCVILIWNIQTPLHFVIAKKPWSFCQRLAALFILYAERLLIFMLCYYFKGPYNWFYPRLSHLVRPAYLIWDRHLSSIYHTAKAFYCRIHIYTSDALAVYLVSRVLLLMLGIWLFNHSFSYVSSLILWAQRSSCQYWASVGLLFVSTDAAVGALTSLSTTDINFINATNSLVGPPKYAACCC